MPLQEVLQLDIVRKGLLLYHGLVRSSKMQQQEIFNSSLQSGLINPAVSLPDKYRIQALALDDLFLSIKNEFICSASDEKIFT